MSYSLCQLGVILLVHDHDAYPVLITEDQSAQHRAGSLSILPHLLQFKEVHDRVDARCLKLGVQGDSPGRKVVAVLELPAGVDRRMDDLLGLGLLLGLDGLPDQRPLALVPTEPFLMPF